jgi:hypothetical protein
MSLPFDLAEIVSEELAAARRPHDSLLHASSHLTGSLRHAELAVAGAPTIDSPLVSTIRMHTGTMWHKWLQDRLVDLGIPFMQEVNLTPWMPKGWGGTADFLFWIPDAKAFKIEDLKTTKGEGMRYLQSGGAKIEHKWQTSLYYHAARRMGLPMVKEVGILYLPMNDTRDINETIEPLEVNFEPISWDEIQPVAKDRAAAVKAYTDSLPPIEPGKTYDLTYWVTDALAPVQDRELKPYFNRRDDKWELKLIPHWSAQFCPYPTELCSCREAGTTKVGEWAGGIYVPRKGADDEGRSFDSIQPPPYPG